MYVYGPTVAQSHCVYRDNSIMVLVCGDRQKSTRRRQRSCNLPAHAFVSVPHHPHIHTLNIYYAWICRGTTSHCVCVFCCCVHCCWAHFLFRVTLGSGNWISDLIDLTATCTIRYRARTIRASSSSSNSTATTTIIHHPLPPAKVRWPNRHRPRERPAICPRPHRRRRRRRRHCR